MVSELLISEYEANVKYRSSVMWLEDKITRQNFLQEHVLFIQFTCQNTHIR